MLLINKLSQEIATDIVVVFLLILTCIWSLYCKIYIVKIIGPIPENLNNFLQPWIFHTNYIMLHWLCRMLSWVCPNLMFIYTCFLYATKFKIILSFLLSELFLFSWLESSAVSSLKQSMGHQKSNCLFTCIWLLGLLIKISIRFSVTISFIPNEGWNLRENRYVFINSSLSISKLSFNWDLPWMTWLPMH